MIHQKIDSLEGCYDELFFRNSSPHPAGDIVGAGLSVPLHNHGWWDMGQLWSYPYYTFSIMLEGGAGNYRDENDYSCQLGYGDALFTTPRFKHICGPGKNEQWSNIYVSFVGEIFDIYVQSGVLSKDSPAWKLPSPAKRIKELQKILTPPRPTNPTETACQASHLLHLILNISSESTPLTNTSQTSDWFPQACMMLSQDLHHKVSLSKVAKQLGMSYNTFRIYFSRRAGVSPQRYRDKIRIETACDLLKNNPSKSCQAIAFTLGFCNGDHFSYYFKQHIGMSPSNYRKTHLQD